HRFTYTTLFRSQDEWALFRERQAHLDMLLVEGNHDRVAARAGLAIECQAERTVDGPFVFTLAPLAATELGERFGVCGHLHPLVRVPGFKGPLCGLCCSRSPAGVARVFGLHRRQDDRAGPRPPRLPGAALAGSRTYPPAAPVIGRDRRTRSTRRWRPHAGRDARSVGAVEI